MDKSYFIYDVFTDKLGHMLSRQSELYLKVIAASIANLDILYDFFQYRVTNKSKMNLIIMSDHGLSLIHI